GMASVHARRMAIVRSFTLEPAVPMLRASAFCTGIDLTVNLSDFNAYAQEILDTKSSLYEFAPDIVLLVASTADIAPDLWSRYPQMSDVEIREAVGRVCNNVHQWVHAFRQLSQ